VVFLALSLELPTRKHHEKQNHHKHIVPKHIRAHHHQKQQKHHAIILRMATKRHMRARHSIVHKVPPEKLSYTQYPMSLVANIVCPWKINQAFISKPIEKMILKVV